MKTTGYEHGANTPIGIRERHKYPIFISQEAEDQATIIVSAGKVGRSVGIDSKILAQFVDAQFTDIATQD